MELSLPLTASLLIIAALFTALCGYMGGRTLKAHEGPRMVPWRFLMILAFTVALLMIVHLLSLFGIQTKPPLQY